MSPTKTSAKSSNIEQPVKSNHRTIVGQNRRIKTKVRIIKSALSVFAEKGPDAPVIDDFIKAAGIARGTFYNYYNNTKELLKATSDWLSDDVMDSIEIEVKEIQEPALRLGVGIRYWLMKANTDPDWCKFVSNVWIGDWHERVIPPKRDLELAINSGELGCNSLECSWDLTLGTIRQAMIRMLIVDEVTGTKYINQIVDTILNALGASSSKRKQILSYKLSDLQHSI